MVSKKERREHMLQTMVSKSIDPIDFQKLFSWEPLRSDPESRGTLAPF